MPHLEAGPPLVLRQRVALLHGSATVDGQHHQTPQAMLHVHSQPNVSATVKDIKVTSFSISTLISYTYI